MRCIFNICKNEVFYIKKIAISIVLVILVLCGIFFIVNTYLTGDMISEDINTRN